MLAAELACRAGGVVRPVFHTDSEPSLVPGMGHFLHLTQGFEIVTSHGEPLCTLVDDVTITEDLDAQAPPRAGWFRILSDEPRLLRLIAHLADPGAPLGAVLDPVAAVFGVSSESVGDAVRLDDLAGSTVALAAPLRGERERPCEIVTSPLIADHAEALDALLAPARDLGFAVPVEAAVHLHVDAAPFRTVTAFCNVVRLFGHWREALWRELETNPACRRLSPLPAALLELVERPWEELGGWPALQVAARATGLTKFFDVNLTKVLADRPDRHTLEVRILPGSLDADATTARAAFIEALLLRCRQSQPVPRPTSTCPAESAAELGRLASGAL